RARHRAARSPARRRDPTSSHGVPQLDGFWKQLAALAERILDPDAHTFAKGGLQVVRDVSSNEGALADEELSPRFKEIGEVERAAGTGPTCPAQRVVPHGVENVLSPLAFLRHLDRDRGSVQQLHGPQL